jgi:hypothetical protein
MSDEYILTLHHKSKFTAKTDFGERETLEETARIYKMFTYEKILLFCNYNIFYLPRTESCAVDGPMRPA